VVRLLLDLNLENYKKDEMTTTNRDNEIYIRESAKQQELFLYKVIWLSVLCTIAIIIFISW
jgi:hypothetical protein